MAVNGALVALVEAVRIDQRMGDGKRARALVVIDDDHVNADGSGHFKRLEGLGAAIDGDDQLGAAFGDRSEEHTSELQSLMRISSAVFCLKKKKHKNHHYDPIQR